MHPLRYIHHECRQGRQYSKIWLPTCVCDSDVRPNACATSVVTVKRCFGATMWTPTERAPCSTKGSLRDSPSSGEPCDDIAVGVESRQCQERRPSSHSMASTFSLIVVGVGEGSCLPIGRKNSIICANVGKETGWIPLPSDPHRVGFLIVDTLVHPLCDSAQRSSPCSRRDNFNDQAEEKPLV